MAEGEQLELPDVVVKIDDAPPAADVTAKPDAVKDLAAQYKELEAKNAQETTAREEAERREAASRHDAEQARRETASARSAAAASNLDTITTAIAASTSAVEAAKRDMRVAKEAGDLDAELEAQDRLTSARIDLRTYDEAKATMEARAKVPPRPSDPVEAYIHGRTEQTATWLRAHREYITDPRKNQKLRAAHHDAVSDGLSPDTPEYFTHVEQFIGLRKADSKELTEGDNVQRPGARRAASALVAPVAGSRGAGSAADANEVRLTRGEAERATDGTHVWNYDDPSGQKRFKKGDPIGVQEFARRKRAMTASGQYDRTYETQ